MKILYFCPHWGNTLPFEQFCKNVKIAGYDGVEMDLPFDKSEKENILKTLESKGLKLIGQYWQSLEKDFEINAQNYSKHLYNLADAKPLLINTQTGKDYFSFEQNMMLISIAEKISEETGIEILHETHRGKFLFNLPVFQKSVESNKNIAITLDASHWCTVHESMLDDQEEAMMLALQHTRHIHSRIGFEEGPQVNDPRAPEWKSVVEKYFSWWDQVVAIHQKNKQTLTVTTEFGPAPYMPAEPYTGKSLSSQWDVNVHMLNMFKERYFTK